MTQIGGATAGEDAAPSRDHAVLNEAYDYAKPSSFSRGLRIDLNGLVILLISGTASIDEQRRNACTWATSARSCRRTYHNITGLLAAEGATWKDVVRTTCYLRDIERDYAAFNEERTAFFRGTGSRSAAGFHRHPGDPVPAGAAGGNRSHRHVHSPGAGVDHAQANGVSGR